jgi:hypothetical protein
VLGRSGAPPHFTPVCIVCAPTLLSNEALLMDRCVELTYRQQLRIYGDLLFGRSNIPRKVPVVSCCRRANLTAAPASAILTATASVALDSRQQDGATRSVTWQCRVSLVSCPCRSDFATEATIKLRHVMPCCLVDWHKCFEKAACSQGGHVYAQRSVNKLSDVTHQ